MMSAMKSEYHPNYTYDDYKLWEGDWELIYGLAYAMAPAPMIKHQAISNKIAWQLQDALKECKVCQALLPIDWKVDDSTIVQPDNLVICHEPQYEAYIVKAPKIIFEVLSKSTASKDLNLKYDLYEQEGVNYYVIVDPNDSIAKVYKLNSEGRYMKVSDAHNETVKFDLDECSFTFDFSKIW
jgi:Uma2 family endonuclease